MVDKYIPKQGDIVYINLNKPAIVISGNTFNEYTKMAILCPITSNIKEYPTHYVLEDTKKIQGAVLCEHARSIDYDARNIKFIESISNNDLRSIITLFNACIEE